MASVVKIVAAASAAAASASGGGCGNVGVCYDPFHLDSYPLNSDDKFNSTTFSEDLDADFAAMSKYFTHVRTYYSRFYGVDITPFAAKHGIKLDLGVFTTYESWMDDQIDGAVHAIKNYPDAIDTVLVGNENLYQGWTATRIVKIVNEIKNKTASTCDEVKFGTVQRFTEYVDSNYKTQIQYLDDNLDVLGVNLYPNMADSYRESDPTAVLDYQWNQVTSAVTASKVRLTEVGFPTAGNDIPAQSNADSRASIEHALNYYNAIVDWTQPTGDASFPKFWFSMHDRRENDYTQSAVYEHYFGFLTHDGKTKTDNFPFLAGCVSSSAASSSSSNSSANTPFEANSSSFDGETNQTTVSNISGSHVTDNTSTQANSPSESGSGSAVTTISETGSGSAVTITPESGSGSAVNTTSDFESGSTVNTIFATGSGSTANSTSETGSGFAVNDTSESSSGSVYNTTPALGGGSITKSHAGSGKKLCPDYVE